MKYLPSRPAARAAALLLACAATLSLPARSAPEPVTLNLVDVDIASAARALAEIMHTNIVIDPRVKGTLTLATDHAVPPAAAFEQFVATLRLAGYAVVQSQGLLKVVPEADAKLLSGTVVEQVAAGNQVATQIFRLDFAPAANLLPVLRPLVSPNNTINIDPGTNALVVTDYADNLRRIGRIIAALDLPNAGGVEIIPLQHALATDLATTVLRLLDAAASTATASASAPGAGAGAGAAAGQGDTVAHTSVVAEPQTNALLVRTANAARLAQVRALVLQLDAAAASVGSGNIHVVQLRNAEATRLAIVLRAALAATAPTATGAGAGGAGGGGAMAAVGASAPPSSSSSSSSSSSGSSGSSAATTSVQPSAQPSTGGQIQADPATNSLIITAPEPQYRQLRAVIDQLDGRRAQVLVESLIVEVSADKAAEFGVQWQNLLGSTSSSVVGYVGSNYSVGGTNIISLTTGAATGSSVPSTGLNIGLARNIGGSYVLGLLARFFESSGDANVLSTPNLLTLDNEEAKIVIGQNVPFVTGQYTSTSSTSSTVNPFQTIERKDVGLTLRVKPQISENGTVRLTLYQEVSSVDASTASNANGPTTNKRTIESTVLVEDGAVVVLGGLLQDEYANSQEKVPGVSALPWVGNLFRSETRSRKKTNLMVFIRPVVLRDAAGAQAVSTQRYDQMRSMQQESQPVPSRLTPVEGAPVLPPAH
ncbi:type II secretion system secretin GspD [Ramlibacter sp.]|uniref:type II secretion system secretin GspD n=1 Tax=Ramlibacter sp. TaxID=1917967 RepID=UPI002621FB41|nr:type II secretion system secretin GspD [Ramlibacter sp.]